MAKDKNPKNKRSTVKRFLKREEEVFGETGLGGTALREPRPHYNKSEEQMYYSHKNSYIIFGRDRNASKYSGFGGMGKHRSDAIDIVVGLASGHSKDGPPDKNVAVNPNFFSDAARVYITQKGNVDKYFGLAKGKEIFSTKGQSAVVMKADHARIIGTNSVKIVAGKGKMTKPGKFGEKNSQGGDEEHTYTTIDLIAGNYTEDSLRNPLKGFDFLGKRLEKKLQPLVKGENLVLCLEDVYDLIQKCFSYIQRNNKDIVYLYTALQNHFHETVVPTPIGAFIATPSAPLRAMVTPFKRRAIKRIVNTKLISVNANFSTINYLSKTGSKYINSKYVHTT
jgi:hypothetical protein